MKVLPLFNATFTIAVVNVSKFIIDKLPDGTLIGRQGRYFELINLLSTHLGFKYRLSVPPDNQYGVLDEQGQWNGMIRMVLEGEADMIGVCLVTSVTRIKVISLSPTCELNHLTFISKKASATSLKKDFLSSPFQTNVWLFIGILSSIILCMIPFVNICLSKKFKLLSKRFSTWEIIFVIMGNKKIEMKWSRLQPHYFGIFITLIALLASSVFKIYGSVLSSSVTRMEPGDAINNIKDLILALKYRGYSIGLIQSTDMFITLLKISSRNDLRIIGDELEKGGNDSLKSWDEALDSILNWKFVLIQSYKTFVNAIVSHGLPFSQINFPKEELFTCHLHFGYNKSFVHKEPIDRMIGQFRTNGLLEKLSAYNNFKVEKEMGSEKLRKEITYIDLVDLDVIFVWMLYMLSIAAFMQFLEKMYLGIISKD